MPAKRAGSERRLYPGSQQGVAERDYGRAERGLGINAHRRRLPFFDYRSPPNPGTGRTFCLGLGLVRQ